MKASLCAVIGGIVGAVQAMMIGSFSALVEALT